MHILQATSEFYPYSKTGGLADMVAGLSRALVQRRHELSVVTPLYQGIKARFEGLRPAGRPFIIPMGRSREKVRYWVLSTGRRMKIYFVQHNEYYDRPELYMEHGEGYWDNPERFILFSKAVVRLAQSLKPRPHVVHCHDWQAGLVPSLLTQQFAANTRPMTCYTIQNLAYQGICGPDKFALTGLPKSAFNVDGIEFFGRLNPMKAGLVFADQLTTVSPNYTREILTSEFGEGLEGVLLTRQQSLKGILNGVDYDTWKTTGNPHLPFDYSADDLSGKRRNKMALQRELKLPSSKNSQGPLFVSIGRLARQKGTELLLDSMNHWLQNNDGQLVILGSGDPTMESRCQSLCIAHPDKVRVCISHDEPLAHKLEAAADFFVMPSLYEPCGLNQLYSLRYGTIPLVFSTGGLTDTVMDLREHPRTGTGFTIQSKSTESLFRTYTEASALAKNRLKLNRIRKRGMRADFSWNHSAEEYERLYLRTQLNRDQRPNNQSYASNDPDTTLA